VCGDDLLVARLDRCEHDLALGPPGGVGPEHGPSVSTKVQVEHATTGSTGSTAPVTT
jgi:hypothetical protein